MFAPFLCSLVAIDIGGFGERICALKIHTQNLMVHQIPRFPDSQIGAQRHIAKTCCSQYLAVSGLLDCT